MAIRRARVSASFSDPGKTELGPEAKLLDKSERIDSDVLRELLPAAGEPLAGTTVSFEAKANSNLYFGPGTFDRISYTVGCFCSVSLHCAQTEEALQLARAHAQQLAWETTHAALRWGVREQRKLIEATWPRYENWFDPGMDAEDPFAGK